MVDRVLAMPEGTRLLLLAPIVRGRKGEYRKELADLMKRGFQRVKVDGKLLQIDEVPPLNKKLKHDDRRRVDRVVVKPASSSGSPIRRELRGGAAASPTASRSPRTPTTASAPCSRQVRLPGLRLHAPRDRAAAVLVQQPPRRLPGLRRLGAQMYFDPELVVPDERLSLRQGADRALGQVQLALLHADAGQPRPPLQGASTTRRGATCPSRCATPSCTAPARSGRDQVRRRPRAYTTRKPFEGVIPNLERRWRETDSAGCARRCERFQSMAPCEACGGYRLKPEALSVKVDGRHIGEVTELSIPRPRLVRRARAEPGAKQREIAGRILKEINDRLGFLVNVGLEYLALSRNAGTLSGGESQRIRLASQIGSGLTGVLYVLDEPSIGLHQRDNERLLGTLRNLRDLGNSVLVVEHDEEAIRTPTG
jgi:excinuclease ABC subunit A